MKHYNILIINNGLSGGGIERASTTLANYYKEQGHNITVLALYPSDHFYKLHEEVKFIEPSFTREYNNKIIYLIKMILFVRKQIKQISPDTILSFGEWTNPFVILANIGLKTPLYLSDRMSPELKLPYYNEVLKKNLYKKANGIIAQTNYARDQIYNRTKADNIIVIPNPVNVIERKNIEEKNIIVTVGRLSPEKGHKFLIDAFSRIDNKSWLLSIIGDGPEYSKLVNLVNERGISDRVIFHGYQKDFSKELSEAKIFVLPSLQEGFPNALLEAMSIPLACISTKYMNGDSEIIENGVNGLLVEPSNSKQLCEAMNKLIENVNLRNNIADKAFEVRDKFNINVIAEKYIQFIVNI